MLLAQAFGNERVKDALRLALHIPLRPMMLWNYIFLDMQSGSIEGLLRTPWFRGCEDPKFAGPTDESTLCEVLAKKQVVSKGPLQCRSLNE